MIGWSRGNLGPTEVIVFFYEYTPSPPILFNRLEAFLFFGIDYN